MLYRDFVESAIYTALDQGKRILNVLRVRVALSITAAVIDDLMLANPFTLADYRVGRMAIGLKRSIGWDVLLKHRLDYLNLGIGDRNQAQFPATLNYYERAGGRTHLCTILVQCKYL